MMTIGYRTIRPAYRFSFWLSKGILGESIYGAVRDLAKAVGWKARRRYRGPVPGARYAWGGSLRREQARCFSVYLDRITTRAGAA